MGDPVTAIVCSAQQHNVDTVVVDGRILKRVGKLTETDQAQAVAVAMASLDDLRKKANWS